jgi:hypothetical protein
LTIEALEAAIDPADLHFDFYERLFDADSMQRLSRFVGVNFRPDFAENRFNQGVDRSAPSDLAAHQAKVVLEPVYAYSFGRFPATRSLWRAA